MREFPSRQVHLDFHTSQDIPGVASKFDAEEFASRLDEARVNSVTCFARCHHGYLYYDSKAFPERVHPKLVNRNLLKEQIEACHKKGIRVPIYTTVQWDQFTVNEHPEWLSIDANGMPVGAPFPKGTPVYEPGFYRSLCVNSPYKEFLKANTKEILETFDSADGLFFDIVFVNECSCKYCRAGMVKKGYNPVMQEGRLKYAAQVLDEFMIEMTEFVRKYNADCSIFYNKSHVGPVHRPVIDAHSHFELESLPSGGVWGYMHFPVTVRYARNMGLDCVGMTGKFHTEWGDFHSFKNKAALEYECFRMLALNAKCSVGDQLEPNGKLSDPVYGLIGSVYSQVEKKEPWCRQAKAVTDIGVLTPEEFNKAGDTDLPSAILGVAKMLSESGHQFDIIDSLSEFSKYKVLIMPDNIPVSEKLNTKISQYVKNGGALIASFESGLNEEKTGFVLSELPVKLKNDMTCDIFGNPVRGRVFPTFDYADYILPEGEIAGGLPATEHVMYIKGLEVEALPQAKVLANVILPYFNRTYAHFCSHRQTPSSGEIGYPGIVRNGNVIYFAHPIFTQYNINAPRWYKQLFLNALGILLPEPVLRHDGPSTLLATLNEQPLENRLVVHMLHYIPERRCNNLDIIEDVIPLYNVKVSIKSERKVVGVNLVPGQKPLEYEEKEGRIEFVVPEIRGHQMIEVQLYVFIHELFYSQ